MFKLSKTNYVLSILAIFTLSFTNAQTFSYGTSLWSEPYNEDGTKISKGDYYFFGLDEELYTLSEIKNPPNSKLKVRCITKDLKIKWEYLHTYGEKQVVELQEVLNDREKNTVTFFISSWWFGKKSASLIGIVVDRTTGKELSKKVLFQDKESNYYVQKSNNQKYVVINRNTKPDKNKDGNARMVIDSELNVLTNTSVMLPKKYYPLHTTISDNGNLIVVLHSPSEKNLKINVYEEDLLIYTIDGAKEMLNRSYVDFQLRLKNDNLYIACMIGAKEGECQGFDVYRFNIIDKKTYSAAGNLIDKTRIQKWFSEVPEKSVHWAEAPRKGPGKFKKFRIEDVSVDENGSVYISAGKLKTDTDAEGNTESHLEDGLITKFEADGTQSWTTILLRFNYGSLSAFRTYYNPKSKSIEMVSSDFTEKSNNLVYRRINPENGNIIKYERFPKHCRNAHDGGWLWTPDYMMLGVEKLYKGNKRSSPLMLKMEF